MDRGTFVTHCVMESFEATSQWKAFRVWQQLIQTRIQGHHIQTISVDAPYRIT
uniref:Uncharacterized protein n=1 Tax=Globisporangium ultimum (strain ATCC 200006 / CBS 805.95 / DAOM BR144) TaxID=431595 RepID=K3WZF1_GLOUD